VEHKIGTYLSKLSKATGLNITTEEQLNEKQVLFLGVSFTKKPTGWESVYKYKLPSVNSFPHVSSNQSLKDKLTRMFNYFNKVMFFTSDQSIKEIQINELKELLISKGYKIDHIEFIIKRAVLSLKKKYVDQMTVIPQLEELQVELGSMKYNRFPTLFRILQKRDYSTLNGWSKHSSIQSKMEKNQSTFRNGNKKQNIEKTLQTDFFKKYIL